MANLQTRGARNNLVELGCCRQCCRADCGLGTICGDARYGGAGWGRVRREETMQKTLSYAALAAALAIASPVLAQATSPGATREAAAQSAPPSSAAPHPPPPARQPR